MVTAGYEKNDDYTCVEKTCDRCKSAAALFLGGHIMEQRDGDGSVDGILSIQEDVGETGLVYYADIGVGKKNGASIHSVSRRKWGGHNMILVDQQQVDCNIYGAFTSCRRGPFRSGKRMDSNTGLLASPISIVWQLS